MPIDVTLTDEMIARMQKHAVPLVDTPLSMIARALDALDAAAGGPTPPSSPNVAIFNAAAAPNLSYTTPQLARVGGALLPGGKTYWNPILFAVIEEAVDRGVTIDEICELLTINNVRGERLVSGYKYIERAGISVQGQDANAAWKQIYRLAAQLGIPVEVQFAWQNTPKASLPGIAGSLKIEGTRNDDA